MTKQETRNSKKKGTAKAVQVLVALMLLVQCSIPLCFSQELAGIPSSLKNPQDVEKWLSGFRTQMQFPDVPQTVREMLDTRVGDCDDFAVLASKALSGLGIANTVLVIKFKDTNIRHAICLWKNDSGSYDFFTTKTLIHSGKTSVEEVLKRYYPSAQGISALNIRERAAL